MRSGTLTYASLLMDFLLLYAGHFCYYMLDTTDWTMSLTIFIGRLVGPLRTNGGKNEILDHTRLVIDGLLMLRLEGVWLRLLNFNRYCSIFVLFNNYCLIMD